MIGYEYGNTRLRVRMTRILDRPALLRLLAAGDIDRMLAELGSGDHGPDVEAALARRAGGARLDEAIRTHLARSLREMRSFYEGPAAAGLDLLLGRWDVRNLLAVLRTAGRPDLVSDVLGRLVPAGILDDPLLRELAAQPGVRAVVELMVAWGVPDPETAGSLLGVLGRVESVGDPILLEATLLGRHAERVAAETSERPDDAVASQLRAEFDAGNVASALRVRQARLDGEPLPVDWTLPAGTPAAWERIIEVESRDEAAAHIVGWLRPKELEGAVAAWAVHGDLARLADDLDAALATVARRRAVSGDPLGPAVPVAYVWSKEEEARLLRLVGRAVLGALDRAEVEERLAAR